MSALVSASEGTSGVELDYSLDNQCAMFDRRQLEYEGISGVHSDIPVTPWLTDACVDARLNVGASDQVRSHADRLAPLMSAVVPADVVSGRP